MRSILLVTIIAGIGLSACAPAAPTVDPAQIQASAMAAASTMIAMTQAAIPSPTPEPPTAMPSPTPLPPPTLAPLPTLSGPASPTAAASGSGGDCNQLFDVGASGPTANVMIRNNTKGSINFSMGISRKNTFGQCGYISWPVPKGNSISVSVPQVRTNLGDPCYWTYAWVNDPKHQTTVSASGFCIDNAAKWTFDVNYDTIHLTPP